MNVNGTCVNDNEIIENQIKQFNNSGDDFFCWIKFKILNFC